MDYVVMTVLIVSFVLLRWWLGSLIGKAAQCRGYSYQGWSISSFLIGPSIVWIVYMLFVHWRPTIPTRLHREYVDDDTEPSEESVG